MGTERRVMLEFDIPLETEGGGRSLGRLNVGHEVTLDGPAVAQGSVRLPVVVRAFGQSRSIMVPVPLDLADGAVVEVTGAPLRLGPQEIDEVEIVRGRGRRDRRGDARAVVPASGLMREAVDAKGVRYLAEGRLVVRRVDDEEVRATCRGGGEVYALGFSFAHGGWWCGCPARSRCAHLEALQRVTVRPRTREG